ncbi:hypothetical protein ACFYN0_34845 [Streptomyces sp. NPDC006704]|uniref:hypothetical protein n=1 Tax=Streptomyces sp. NPDC006704 TaxID=3364760 RepID=UPI00369D1B72
MRNIKNQVSRLTPRTAVLGVLGILTLGVAALSVYVSYTLLVPRFGAWAVPTVAALDMLWLVLQATEIIAGNNSSRTRWVRGAGLALTFVIAAVPTADLIVTGPGGADLAVVLTPVAIVATKVGWWLVLPALGRRMSPGTRQAIDIRRQEVADRLEQMEAEAADRVELLTVARRLERRVGRAETAYRRSTLSAQKRMTDRLFEQSQETAATIAEKPLPAAVSAIVLPTLDGWTPTAPALPVMAVTPAVTQVNDVEHDAGEEGARAALLVTVADVAAVTGVPTPVPGEPLTDHQIDVLLRALRYSDDPPLSYRRGRDAFRAAGFVASEQRIRAAWRELRTKAGDLAEESEEEAEDRR